MDLDAGERVAGNQPDALQSFQVILVYIVVPRRRRVHNSSCAATSSVPKAADSTLCRPQRNRRTWCWGRSNYAGHVTKRRAVVSDVSKPRLVVDGWTGVVETVAHRRRGDAGRSTHDTRLSHDGNTECKLRIQDEPRVKGFDSLKSMPAATYGE